MADLTKDEALAFLMTMRQQIKDRVGFGWFAGKLTELADYIASVADENERMNAYLDSTGARGDYEAFRASRDGGEGTT